MCSFVGKPQSMRKLVFFLILLLHFACQKSESVRFAVCTDVHQDLIHDATDRIGKFVKTAEDKKADFIIQLGDFCLPYESNQNFLDLWNSFDGPGYHALGNHDMDVSPKIVTQDFLGMEKAYYSFDKGDFHFIVLDPNYYKDGDNMVAYTNGNYYAHTQNRAYIPQTQLNWLKEDLAATNKYTIVFSHQSLEHWGGIKNKAIVRKIFAEANKPKKKVIACFCGHDHQDRYAEIDGIHYIGLNSSSYAWVGKKHEYSGRYPETIEEKYPNLKYTIPYRESVFAIVDINRNGRIEISGVQGGFVSPGPDDLGMADHPYSGGISDRIIQF